VPAVIQELDDRTVREIMLLENLQREDLAPLEEAEALQQLLQDDLTQEELGRRLGKSQAWIANRLRLLQAPEDLKQMLISREISPKHVIALLPYVDYAVFKKDILQRLKEELEENGRISVKAFEDLIERVITRFGNENVLCFDLLPYEIEEYKSHLDLSDCQKGCKHIVKYENWSGEWRRYCLNRRCWKDKVNLAKQAFEKQRSKDREKLAAKGEVDLSKLHYSTDYHLLKYAQFDTAECESCENCKLDSDKDLVCFDVSCYEKKRKAHRREESKKAREEEQRTYEALDAWLDTKDKLNVDDLKLIVRLLASTLWTESVKKALTPWGKPKNLADVQKIVKTIPDEELHKALLRFVIVRQLDENYGHATREKLKKILPDVVIV
jgi:ParB-like chromosome segregation protein Spo0J